MYRLLPICFFLYLSGCGGGVATPDQPPAEAAPAEEVPADQTPAENPENADFKVRFDTTAGAFVVQVHRDWAPIGAERFHSLVRDGYYTDIAFFRVISGFMAQFGIHGDPAVNAQWEDANIEDDPVVASNRRGKVTFATAGPNTRTVQLFINYGDNRRLDAMGFAPFGEVVEGMEVVDALHAGYGEGAPAGQGPEQERIQSEGNAYLRASFPKLDYIKTATLVEE